MKMGIENTNYKASLQHNDFLLENWYTQQEDLADTTRELVDFDNVKARYIYAKTIVDWLNDELNLNIKFVDMYFPKFYNFESDEINYTFNDADFEKLSFLFNDEYLKQQFESFVFEVTKSTIGYHAYYSYSEVMNNKELKFKCMLQVYYDLHNEDFDSYFDMQNVYDKLQDACTYEYNFAEKES